MLAQAQNVSTRTVARGRLWTRLIVLTVVGTIALAGTAHADSTPGDVEGVVQGVLGGETGGTPATAGEPGEGPPGPVPGGEQAPAEPPAPAGGGEGATPPIPVVEEAVPVPLPVPVPAGEGPATVPITEEAVPVPVPVPAGEGPAPVPIAEEVIPPPPGPVAVEEVPASVSPPPEGSEPTTPTPRPEEAPSSPTLGHETPAALTSLEAMKSSAPASQLAAAGEPLLAVPTTVGSPPAPGAGVPGETWIAGAANGLSLASASPRTSTAQQAQALNCALSALGGSSTAGCGGALMTPSALLGAPTASVTVQLTQTSAAWAVAARTGGGSSGGGGSAGGTRPVGPTPGPTPGGASGGTAAGASGIALSAFLTLAGLLLMAAPRALRRLRLSSQPWRTAFFVLIPERPG